MRLIDAEHLKKRATNAQGDCWDNYGQGTADFLEYIDKEPTVDATIAKNATVGHWEKQRNIQKYQISPYVFVCDQCHTVFDIPTPYCGFCGARMDNTI